VYGCVPINPITFAKPFIPKRIYVQTCTEKAFWLRALGTTQHKTRTVNETFYCGTNTHKFRNLVKHSSKLQKDNGIVELLGLDQILATDHPKFPHLSNSQWFDSNVAVA